MADNLSTQIETAPDLSPDQTASRRAIITSPEAVLMTADIPFPTNPTGPTETPAEDQEPEDNTNE